MFINNREKVRPPCHLVCFYRLLSTQKGHKCHNPLSRKFYISVGVTFNENKHPLSRKSYISPGVTFNEKKLVFYLFLPLGGDVFDER